MHRPFTYTAKLSPSVHTRLSAFLEQQRLLSNAALAERMGASRKAGLSLSRSDQHKSLPALRAAPEVSPYAWKCHRSAVFTLAWAFTGFFRRVKAGQQPGLPRFKSRDRGMRSFSTSQPRLKTHGKWNSLSLTGIGRFRFKGQIVGTVLKARVVKTPIRVGVQLGVEQPDAQPQSHPPLGVDGGIQALVTLSDGQRGTKNGVDRERLTVLQQRLSAAKKGSKSRQKRKRMPAKEWQRIREQAHGQLHEMTADLVKKTTCSYLENVNVQGMMQHHNLARSIAAQQWTTVVDRLTSKAASAGGWVKKVDPRNPSQAWSRCGQRVKQTLSDRRHACPACGLSIDRDWNAALNILNRGLTVSPPSGGNAPSVTIGGKNGSDCYFSL